MRHTLLTITFAGTFTFLVIALIGQEAPTTGRGGANATPEQRAASTREFLGLGAAPDKEAAARAAPCTSRTVRFAMDLRPADHLVPAWSCRTLCWATITASISCHS